MPDLRERLVPHVPARDRHGHARRDVAIGADVTGVVGGAAWDFVEIGTLPVRPRRRRRWRGAMRIEGGVLQHLSELFPGDPQRDRRPVAVVPGSDHRVEAMQDPESLRESPDLFVPSHVLLHEGTVELDAHTGIPEQRSALERPLEGAGNLGDSVELNCPLMKQNVGGYKEIRALAERLGVLHGFDPMITARNDGDRSPVALRITRKELGQVLQDPALNPHCAAPAPAASGPDWKRPDLDEVPCGASHNACYISAYGDVTPCVAMPVPCGDRQSTRLNS